jgi:hypothetical protein
MSVSLIKWSHQRLRRMARFLACTGFAMGAFAVMPAEAAQSRCNGEGKLRSLNSGVATSVTFQNDTAGPVRIYWLDFAGERVFYNELASGASYRQQTYVTHPWVAVSASGRCRGPFKPTRKARKVRLK